MVCMQLDASKLLRSVLVICFDGQCEAFHFLSLSMAQADKIILASSLEQCCWKKMEPGYNQRKPFFYLFTLAIKAWSLKDGWLVV